MKISSYLIWYLLCALVLGCLEMGCQVAGGNHVAVSNEDKRGPSPDPSLADSDFRLVLKAPDVVKSTDRFEVIAVVVNCGSGIKVIDEGSPVVEPYLLLKKVGSSIWKDPDGTDHEKPFGPFEGFSLSRNFLISLAPRQGRAYQYNVDLSSFLPGVYDIAAVKFDSSCGVITAMSRIQLLK